MSILVVDDETDVVRAVPSALPSRDAPGTYVLHYASLAAEAWHRLAREIDPSYLRLPPTSTCRE
jgi:CheY-like chemotaxis protein